MLDFPSCEVLLADTLDYCRQVGADLVDDQRCADDGKSFDLVFGSPPYENCRDYGNADCEHFNLRGEAWIEWAVARFRAQLACCRGAVVWVVEGKTEDFSYSGTPLLLFADLKRAGVTMRKPLAYRRVGIPGSGGPDGFRNDYEFCIVGTNGGKLPWSDNTACGAPPKYRAGGNFSNRKKDGTRVDRENKPPALANPGNVIDEPRYTAADVQALMMIQAAISESKTEANDVIDGNAGGGHMGATHDHSANEAAFPEWLAARFVRSWCAPGGLVYDGFSGSGTTASVCLQYGRRFVGTDVRQDQVDATWRRIDETKRLMMLEQIQKGG